MYQRVVEPIGFADDAIAAVEAALAERPPSRSAGTEPIAWRGSRHPARFVMAFLAQRDTTATLAELALLWDWLERPAFSTSFAVPPMPVWIRRSAPPSLTSSCCCDCLEPDGADGGAGSRLPPSTITRPIV